MPFIVGCSFSSTVSAMTIRLSIPETERLARCLAEATGESITVALTPVRKCDLQRRDAGRSFSQYLIPDQRLQQRIRERQVLDARAPDDLIGADDDGAPASSSTVSAFGPG